MDRGNAPHQIAERHACEPGSADHGSKALLVWEGADAFDQIAVGLDRPGGQRPQARDHLEGMKVVQPIEHGHLTAGKFQAQEAPARPEHAVGLAQRPVDMGDIADAEADGKGIKLLVGKGQRLRIADRKDGAGGQPGLADAGFFPPRAWPD